MPKVSVVIPTYNRAYIINKSINSVLDQTFRDFELIIVDDGSTDNTKEIISRINDSRIIYLHLNENRGVAAATNKGFEKSLGKYIAINASDDLWISDKLKKQVEVIEAADEKVGVVYGRMKKTMSNGKKEIIPPHTFIKNEGNIHAELLKKNFITPQVILMKRECFEKEGGLDESKDMVSFEDWDYWIKISKKYEFKFIPDIVVKAKVMSDSLTSNHEKRLRAREAVFKKNINIFKMYPSIYAMHSYNIGHSYLLRGKRREGTKYLKMAFTSKPYVLKFLLAYLLSLLGSNIYKKIANYYAKYKN